MSSSTLKMDPEWAPKWEFFKTLPKPTINDVFDLRKAANAGMGASIATLPVRTDVEETKHTIQSVDGTNIDVHRFVPASASSQSSAPQRAIVYGFGGGMVAGSVELWSKAIQALAHRTETQVFAVQYRLAPEHKAPAAVEDFYASVKWLQAHAAEFNVDPKRIVLHGKSAGGGIAAGAALMARDKGELEHPIAAMVLSYPMLDDRTDLPADHPLNGYLIFTQLANTMGWAALLGKEREERTDENVSIYAAPARAKDLTGLPDTYINISGLDLFRQEDIQFASRLQDAGVYVEFHLYPGVAHGFDSVPDMKVSQEARESETRFFKSY